jgi:branched-subunit amino acid transport protein
MSFWYLALAFGGVALGAFGTRSAFFFLPGHVELPARLVRALRYAPVCALTAIVAPAVLTSHGDLTIHLDNYRIWAVAAATLVFLKTRSMLLMMTAGLGTFTLLRLVF